VAAFFVSPRRELVKSKGDVQMPHLWIQQPDREEWGVFPLTGTAYGLSEQALSAIDGPAESADEPGPPAIVVRDSGPLERWLLLARKQARVQVNGAPLVLGARILCDKDEILVQSNGSAAALHCYFATERRAEVIVADGPEVRCPRCKQPIEKGQMAVRCPNPECRALHHQDERSGLCCWSYAATCTLCPQDTRLDANYRWSPVQL
jgi:hypothetical protein